MELGWRKSNDQGKYLERFEKRLQGAVPRVLPERSVLIAATAKAATITPQRKKKDYAFLITRYTGCRTGAANGLRHCDLDLENKTIH